MWKSFVFGFIVMFTLSDVYSQYSPTTAVSLSSTQQSQNPSVPCPKKCLCFRKTVRCMFLHLDRIPKIPVETTILDLRFNKIRDIPAGTFRGLKHLDTLLLNNNMLTSLRDGAFAGLTSLRYLYLYKNRISHIDPAVFQGLPRLEQLYLHYNDLKQFDAKVFSSIPSVDRLFLHNNRITHIPSGSFKDMPALKRLRLDSNALVCDCGLMWLVKMLNVSSVQAAATCQTPNDMNGKSINGMMESDFKCHKPKIMEGPHDVEVKWGGTAKFTCRVAGDPTPEVVWMKNSTKLEPDNRISILPDGSLQIDETKDVDIGEYECMAKSDMGEAKSRPARMVVDGRPQPRDVHKPEFVLTPEDQDVQIGEHTVRLECRAKGIPAPTVVWSRNGVILAPNPRYTVTPEGTLVIQNIERGDFGTYRCEASNILGKISTTAQIRINVAPAFTVHPENLTVKTGADAHIECIASGSPIPDIKWYKNGRLITTTARISIEPDGTRLVISHTKESDSGQYICKATNFLGSKETSAYLTVQSLKQQPPKLKIKPYDIEAIPESTVEIPCRAEGIPKPDIQWKKDGSSLDRFEFRYRVSPAGSLFISNVTRRDAARFECTATNENGRISASAVLTVKNSEILAPGDRFVRISFAEATQEVDKAINNTINTLFNQKSGKHNPSDLFRLIRFPDAPTRELARAAEIYDRTLINIRKHVDAGMVINHTANYDYKEILSPDHLDLVARLSGCMAHRLMPNCTNMCFHKKYRSFTGTCNNLQNPTWGASNTGFRRILKPIYENGFSTPIGWNKGIKYYGFEKPSARLVSTTVISTDKISLDEYNSHMLMQWGQFLDHDLDHATPSVSSESWDGIDCKKSCDYAAPCYPMEVPPNDPRIKNRRCIDFIRSSAVCGSGMTSVFFENVQPREQINQLTSYIDASQVYGFNDELARILRDQTTNGGKLRVGIEQPNRKPLLPYAGNEGIDCRRDPEESDINCFAAGDIRANEQVGLLAMHTLWMREHNRLATELRKLNPTWNSDTLYHEARKIVGAQMQHITYKHWLPHILGKDGMELLGTYKEYNPNINPTISNVFATAALRFGHSMINPILQRLNSSFLPIPQGHLPLHKAFFSPWRLVDEGGIDPLLRGLFATAAKLKKPNENLNSDLTEHLFTVAHAVALDLAAMNIQRSRDHGIPGYLEYRAYCNLSKVETFDDLRNDIKDHNIRQILQNLYGHPGNIDVWVGGILEDQLEGSKVGPLFRCLLIEQFRRLRDGDRFWYENPATFKPEQLTQIKQASLARVLCDNGDEINDVTHDVFVLPKRQGGFVECSKIPRIDLRMWSSCCADCQDSSIFDSGITTRRPRRELNVSYPEDKPLFYENSTITDDPSENLITEERIEGIEGVVDGLQKTIKQLRKQMRKLEQQCVDNKSFKHGHCVDDKGSKRLNGEIWQKDDCTKCRCEKHQINCITRECAKPNCTNPTKVLGKCCLTCPAA
ncbi:peroxidasin isoform X3 [Chrysoperla carnea]|uniref:peroxidasin isoform X3 n=1 Tax=Chrysoperla carnea TaxID=189513 RepID=UPI001D05F3EC|nr:peroxidasin isoform X3 [Chrysoperla carnea]